MVLLTEEDKVLVAGVDTVLVAREEAMVLLGAVDMVFYYTKNRSRHDTVVLTTGRDRINMVVPV